MGETTQSTELYKGNKLMLRLNTLYEGERVVGEQTVSFKNETTITIDNNKQTITATRKGYELDSNNKKKTVAKTKSWNYNEDNFITW